MQEGCGKERQTLSGMVFQKGLFVIFFFFLLYNSINCLSQVKGEVSLISSRLSLSTYHTNGNYPQIRAEPGYGCYIIKNHFSMLLLDTFTQCINM